MIKLPHILAFGTPITTPFKSSSGSIISLIQGLHSLATLTDVESILSNPLMTPNTKATVDTLDAIMPTVSSELANGINPYLDTRPYVGFRPTIPHNEAGNRTEPPVSDPRELGKNIPNVCT